MVNRVRPAVIGTAPEGQIAQALQRFGGLVPAALIPDDQPAYDAAMLQALPLAAAAPHSPSREALKVFVAGELLGIPASVPARRRLGLGVRRKRHAATPVPTATLDLSRVDPQ